MTFASLLLGILTTSLSDHQNKKAEANHQEERKTDKDQIVALNGSIQNLKESNQVQYERHRKEIGTLNDKLGDLKEDIATEDLRKKIQTLQGLLDQSLAPTPRAMLEVGFYDGPQYPLRDEFYESVQGEHVTTKVSILNQSDVTAKDVDLWIRICDVCKYAS